MKREIHSFYVGVLFVGALICLVGCGTRPVAPVKPERNGGSEPVLFEDVTASSGVVHSYHNGEEAGHYAILESLGGGVGLVDFDQDGLLDIIFSGGGKFTGVDKRSITGMPNRIFKNLGGFKFRDVSQETGIANINFYTHGVAVADYDRDGWPDLLMTGWGQVVLLHNEPVDAHMPAKGRHFVDVTAKSKVDVKPWSTSAAWADLDGDGWPELYVCQYVDWSFANHPACPGYTPGVDRDVCPPKQFAGLPHAMFRNNRDGTFTDISKEAGIRSTGQMGANKKPIELGKGLGVVIADFDGDRKPDIYVANDTVDNFMYWNQGGLRFEEAGVNSGVAWDERGSPNGSMGVAVGDFDRSGRASLFVTNYEGELHALYRNEGKQRMFTFVTALAGIAALGQRNVGFGTAFADFDNDGQADIVISNGHVIRHPATAGLRQSPVLLRNMGSGRFKIATEQGGEYFKKEHIGRGLAVGDLDNDGRLDLVFSKVNEPVAILRNNFTKPGSETHWLGLELLGKNNADVVGTRVVLGTKSTRQTRFVVGGGSYLSASDSRIHFGLGNIDRVDQVTIEWPNGETQILREADLKVDRFQRIQQGKKPTLDE